jgi:ATP-dependent Clp protease adapter protein ClpS
VLDLFKLIFGEDNSYESFKTLMIALVSKQENLLAEAVMKTQTASGLNNPDMVDIVKCFLNDDMIFLLTTVFKNIFSKHRGDSNKALFVMGNVLASVMVRNHKEVFQLVAKENSLLERFEKEKNLPSVDLDGRPLEGFRWREDFIWVASHLKYFFTTDEATFSEFAGTLFKKVFKFDSIS